MTLPSDWLAAALVGVDGAGRPDATQLPAPLAQLAAALHDRPPGTALLVLAGAAVLHDAAGRLPGRASSTEWYLPAFRPEGDLPDCPPAAAQILRHMLNQQRTELLTEWLALAAAAGWRLPPDLLPQMLDHGARLPRQRPLLLPVLGERGRWLGAINPAWRYAAVDQGDWRSLRAAWDAEPDGRAALAQSIRERDPEMARQLIEATWRGEADAARRELAGVLERGLSMADEPFLERALDDRDAQVRRRAVELLARLEGSRLVARITAALGDILLLEEGELRPKFPAPISDALVRDGVARPLGSANSANDRARLLLQTVGVIPPPYWEQRLGAPPEPIIRAALAGKWPRTLISAFAAAAARHNDRHWAAALLAVDGVSERVSPVFGLLDPEEIRLRLAAAVTANDEEAVVALFRRPLAWDEPAARLLIDFIGQHATRDPDTRHSPTLRYLLRQFVRLCPPALESYAMTALSGRTTNKAWQTALSAFLTTLARRREMAEAME